MFLSSRRVVRWCLIAAVSAAPVTALAAPGHQKTEAGAHGKKAGHGKKADHGDHGDAHAGGHYTGDADADGTPNWRDSDADEALGKGTYVIPSVAFHAFNFLLLLGGLWFAASAFIKTSVKGRALGIRRDIDEAASHMKEVQEKHDALEVRLAALGAEIANIKSNAKKDAMAEQRQIEKRAVATAARVATTAKQQIREEVSRATDELRKEAVELAVELAEGILKKQIRVADQQKLAKEFLASVKSEGRHV